LFILAPNFNHPRAVKIKIVSSAFCLWYTWLSASQFWSWTYCLLFLLDFRFHILNSFFNKKHIFTDTNLAWGEASWSSSHIEDQWNVVNSGFKGFVFSKSWNEECVLATSAGTLFIKSSLPSLGSHTHVPSFFSGASRQGHWQCSSLIFSHTICLNCLLASRQDFAHGWPQQGATCKPTSFLMWPARRSDDLIICARRRLPGCSPSRLPSGAAGWAACSHGGSCIWSSSPTRGSGPDNSLSVPCFLSPSFFFRFVWRRAPSVVCVQGRMGGLDGKNLGRGVGCWQVLMMNWSSEGPRWFAEASITEILSLQRCLLGLSVGRRPVSLCVCTVRLAWGQPAVPGARRTKPLHANVLPSLGALACSRKIERVQGFDYFQKWAQQSPSLSMLLEKNSVPW